jgi:hypothetical protein
MNVINDYVRDVMQVCRNGHVITDLLHTFPERALSHCDRCGAVTYDACLTCGQELPGATYIPEAAPIGQPHPPQFCSACGASFPWTRRPPAASSQAPLCILENLLRKVPLVARELRDRHGTRPAFRIDDEHDLEDLLRALLPLHFADIRLESRTPSYAVDTRTDFLLSFSGIALHAKLASAPGDVRHLELEIREDIYYYKKRGIRTLVIFVYDPESRLGGFLQLETTLSNLSDDMCVRPVIAS